MFIRKNFYYIALTAAFLFAFFLRSYRLAEIPDITHFDEASLGYNAWCLAHYGVDRYLNSMPIYPQNMEGGQSPLYTYAVVLLIDTVGMGNISLFLVRIPGLISSMLVVIFGTKSISLIFQNKKITLMSALLLAVCPYYIMHGRHALDCNMMLGCSTVALYLLTKYIKTQKLQDMIFCGISFGIILYSYALSYFVVPLFLVLITLYMLYTHKITFRKSVLLALCVVITALPVIIFIFSLLFQLDPIKFFCFTISPIASKRMGDVGNSNFWENVLGIIKITLTNSFYPLDAVDKFYTMYFISIPFIIAGFLTSGKHFFVSLKRRRFHYSSVYLLFYICGLITIGLTGTDYIYRANYLFISYLYFLVCGIYTVYRFVRSYQHLFIGTLGTCYLLWSLSFFRYYFNIYTAADIYPNSLYFVPATDAISYAQERLDADNIYIDYLTAKEYYYFYFPFSPYEKVAQEHENGFGRYYFVIDSDTPIDTRNAYIVRQENQEFLSKLTLSGLSYTAIEYPYYYLIYFE